MNGEPASPSGRIVWIARLGAWLVRFIGRTWRIRTSNEEGWRQLRASGRPFIFAFWHGQMLPLLVQHRDEGVAVLISEHGDGEIIARVAMRLGYKTIRGSTSRGATRALVAMAKTIADGTEIAITPDGPRGPARSVAAGVLAIAHRSGVPIVPIGVSAPTAWHLKSWDRFVIPRPFSRIHIVYGDPITIGQANLRDAVAEAPRVRDLIIAAEERARV
jgi:lysophospholipid acyltransferase (LPLAT)-like uncharacterized protein